MHALEPGHGKSFIASYMLGQKLRVRGLLNMLGSMLVSHFLLLAVLALAVKYLFQGVSQGTLLSVQEWVAPAIIFGFGLYLLIRYRNAAPEGDCSCGHHHHDHDAVLDHDHTHHHEEKKERNPALVGFITGLIPCPSALAPVLLSATASFANVLWFIGIYVVGMILVLGAFVAAFYAGRSVAGDALERVGKRVNLNLVSAVLIMAVGVTYFVLNLSAHMSPDHVHLHAGHVH